MTINPRDYDVNELREMARKRGERPGEDGEVGPEDPAAEMEWEALGERAGTGASAGDSLRAGLYRELLPLAGGSEDHEKPYLRTVPDSYGAEFVCFEWLEFLLMHSGYQGATEALHYYADIDWITEDVESTLNDYLLGIDETGSEESADLDVDDHLLSLVYVAKLANMS